MEGVAFTLISLWAVESSHIGDATWRMTDQPRLVELDSILKPVIWTENSTGCARALIPFEFRGLRAVDA